MANRKQLNHYPQLARRSMLALAAASAAGMLRPLTARAQSDGTIRIVVPFTAAGPADVVGRLVAEQLRSSGTVIVDNKPGAGTSIGAAFVARAEPDSNTLLVATAAHVMNAPLVPIRYDPVADFTPITEVAFQPHILSVVADDPIKDFAGFMEEAKRKPGTISVGTAGIGNASHLAGLILERDSGIRLLYVPYGGSSQLQTALLGGQVRASFLNTTIANPLLAAGKIRPLAVTSKTRWRQSPEVPTIAELGFPGYECIAWYGFLGPKGMSPANAERMHQEIRKAFANEHNRKVIQDAGLDIIDVPPKEFGEFLASEYKKWFKVLTDAGLALKS